MELALHQGKRKGVGASGEGTRSAMLLRLDEDDEDNDAAELGRG